MISGLPFAGAERSLVSVLPYFRKIEGVTPFLCTLNTWRDSSLAGEFARTGIQRFDLDAKRLVDPPAWRRFLSLLRDERIDIVSTQDQYSNLFGALAYWASRTPIVMSRHVMQEPADTMREAVRAKLMLLALRYGSSKVIAVSEAVRRNLAQQNGSPLSRIETIYNGIDVKRFALMDQREEIRRKMGWSPDQSIVIMVAVLRRGKGHEVLFEAVPSLVRAVPRAHVKLVGGGELNDSLREQAAGLGDAVEFLGERADVPELLAASDVLVLPSWSEALPTVLIEAGAASLPVVATDVGGTAEIVTSGETGYLVPPGDSSAMAANLVKLLQDPERARRMGAAAQERIASRFSLERQAQSMVSLFNRILGEA
jgi:glycosyltransferase involved in cell wall biosynthesis